MAYQQSVAQTPSAREDERQGVDPLALYPGKETREELQNSEYMNIRGDYRRAALEKLNRLWRHKVPKSSLPSYRLWGMVLRHKWLNGEFQPLDFWQLPNAENGRLQQSQTGERGQLREDARGAGWHLPPINIATPGNQGHLEEALLVLHNTLILSGWLAEPEIIIEWHHKFWTRTRKLTAPQRNNRVPHTINDIIQGHLRFQRQWATYSETHDTLDGCVRKSLPDDEDLVDARMALQPMYATVKQKGPGKGKGGEGTATTRATTKGTRTKGAAAKKGKGKGKTEQATLQSMADRLAQATGSTRAAVLGRYPATQKGKTKAKGKTKGKTKNKNKGKGNNACIDWLNGNCTRGDACRYDHPS